MGKNSIELTLQQLIDLGVINLKKRKRQKHVKRLRRQQRMTDDIFSQNKTPSSHMRGYATPNYLPQLNQNTEALRLRDDNQTLNTRLLEQKLLLENSKQDAEAFQDKTKAAFMHVFNTITTPALGYSDYDADGAFGGSDGSDGFRSMRDNRQDAVISEPDEIPAPSPAIQEVDDDDAYDRSYIRTYGVSSPYSSGLRGRKKFNAAEAYIAAARPSPSASVDDERGRAALFERTPDQPILKAGGGGGGGGGAALPEIGSDNYDHVNATKAKPTKEELGQWRRFYQSLAGDDADPAILNSTRRTVIEPAIVKILIQQYKDLKGNKKEILMSKNSKQIAMEVASLKQLKQIFA